MDYDVILVVAELRDGVTGGLSRGGFSSGSGSSGFIGDGVVSYPKE